MRRLLLSVLIAAVLLPDVASARVTDISVSASEHLGTFAGKPYREASLQVSGIASGGAYSVPVTLAHPRRAADANGFGLVDPYNTVPFWVHVPGAPGAFPAARLILEDAYMFGQGNVYAAVVWDEGMIEASGTGFMATAMDAYDVLRDVAALVRSPRSMPYPRRYDRPPAAAKVIAVGYSQSSNLLRQFHLDHENTSEGLTFDGTLLAGSNANCMTPDAPVVFYVCPGVVSGAGKVLVANTQADVEFAGFTERGRTAGYRVLELAGTAHIPATMFDLGVPNQNPISANPAFRAAHDNLRRWIKGTPPPETAAIELQDVPPVDVGGFPYIPAELDADGNALGGVRLPHMPSVVRGKPAGAPLGTYGALNFDTADAFLGGTFTPFSPRRLRELYPTHRVYVDRVRRAADELLRTRLILRPDRDAYVNAARARRSG